MDNDEFQGELFNKENKEERENRKKVRVNEYYVFLQYALDSVLK